jgi:hypothetical protein
VRMKRSREDLYAAPPPEEEVYIDYLIEKEKCAPRESQFYNVQVVVKQNMRAILIDWMVQVVDEFHMSDSTLLLSVSILDRMFVTWRLEEKDQIQLLGIACMLIAGKFQERYPVTVYDMIYISDNTYTDKQLINMEQHVLFTLDYDLCVPTAYTFFEYIWKRLNNPLKEVFLLTACILEITMLRIESLNYLPSRMATSAIYLAFVITSGQHDDKLLDTLILISKTSTREEILDLQVTLRAWLHASTTLPKTFKASFDKYSRNSRCKVIKYFIHGCPIE